MTSMFDLVGLEGRRDDKGSRHRLSRAVLLIDVYFAFLTCVLYLLWFINLYLVNSMKVLTYIESELIAQNLWFM